jgi:hypothetical protein
MGLIFIGSIENLLEQIAMRRESYTRPVRHICRQVEDGISVVMFGNLHKVLRTSIRKEINPFFWVEDGRCEILDEVVVHHVRTVGVKMVLPGLVLCSRSLIEVPPVPLGV